MIYQRQSALHMRDRDIAAMPIEVEVAQPSWVLRFEVALTGLLIVIVTVWAVVK